MTHHVDIAETRIAAPEKQLTQRPDIRIVPTGDGLLGRTPRVSAGVFCDTPKAQKALADALQDRRLSRITAKVAQGGIEAAIKFYASAPTPDLLILETTAEGAALLASLDRLSSVCDETTNVIVIGKLNDIGLYRAIIEKGVSDYLVAPVDSLSAIAAVLGLYRNRSALNRGRVCAFLGAKRGVGASTLAQNVAWRMGQNRRGPVMLADLDLQFGTAALNLDLNATSGFAQQATDPERLDEALLERTLIQKGRFLHVLPASGRMHEIDPPDPQAVEKLLDLARQTFPAVVLDLPHLQSPWIRTALAAVDDLVIVATPDLVSLRNAKFLLEMCRTARPNDAPPRLVLNQIGIDRRAGVSVRDFAKGLEVDIDTQIAFEPQHFGMAASEGRLITELAPKCRASRAISALALTTGDNPAQRGQHEKKHWFRNLWRPAS